MSNDLEIVKCDASQAGPQNDTEILSSEDYSDERTAKEIGALADSMNASFAEGVRGTLYCAYRIGLLVQSAQEAAPRKKKCEAVQQLASHPDTKLSTASLRRYLSVARTLPKLLEVKPDFLSRVRKNEFEHLAAKLSIRGMLTKISGQKDVPTLDDATPRKKRLPNKRTTASPDTPTTTPASSLHLFVSDNSLVGDAILYAKRLGLEYRCLEAGIHDDGLLFLVNVAPPTVKIPAGLDDLAAYVQGNSLDEVERDLESRVSEYWKTPIIARYPDCLEKNNVFVM